MHILLVDDDDDYNFLHRREIRKVSVPSVVLTKDTAIEALEYLKSKGVNKDPHPDIIFLDINMPRMNGWEFLDEYNLLDKELKGRSVIILLSTSDNPKDEARAKALGFVSDYISKPLTKEKMEAIIAKYFKE